MTNEAIREHCLSLPHATEVVQWEDYLLFKIGGKMFAIMELDGCRCSLKCTPESYADLVEREGIAPTDHNMWKYNWVTAETADALPDREFRRLLTQSYQIVRASLPRRVREQLDSGREASVPPGNARNARTSGGRTSPAFKRKR